MSDSFELEAVEEVKVETPAPKVANVNVKTNKAEVVQDEAKIPANESAVAARAAAVVRSLGTNEGLTKTKAEPSPSSVMRGNAIADKFVARAAQRSN